MLIGVKEEAVTVGLVFFISSHYQLSPISERLAKRAFLSSSRPPATSPPYSNRCKTSRKRRPHSAGVGVRRVSLG